LRNDNNDIVRVHMSWVRLT